MPWLFRFLIRLLIGILKPRQRTVMGMEFAGVIESVGEGVRHFNVDDAVFGASNMGLGSNTEYVRVPADGIVARKPDALSFEQVAAVPVGGLAALGYLRKGGIGPGKTVLVRGASGSIGTFAVQLAKHFGAHVTGVCGTEGVAQVRALGADEVINYTREDFTENGVTYDIILDMVGRMPISRCLRSLSANGCYIRATVPGVWDILRTLWAAMTSSQRIVIGASGDSAEGLVFLGGLLEAGKIQTVIDRRYPLAQIADAHRYVEKGHKQGNVIVTVANNG